MTPNDYEKTDVSQPATPDDKPIPEATAKTHLQAFAEEVAANQLGVDLEKLAKACADRPSAFSLGVSSEDLIALIEIIAQIVVKIIESCPDRSDERLKAAIAQPTFWQRVRVKNLAKDYFDESRHRRWKTAGGSIAHRLIECAQRAESTRVQAVLDEIHSEDKWLI
jgi:hypothetical protein